MNAWLATIVGDTAAPIVGFVLLFILVIVLLFLVFAVLRRVTGGTFVSGGRNRQVRLSVTDAAAVDNRRRLVLVRRDDVEHLILIGGPSDIVIEQNIKQFAKHPSRIEPVTASIAEPEPKPESKPVEPRVQPVPPAPSIERPASPVQAAPQIPLRPPVTERVVSPREVRPSEPPRLQTSPAVLPPIPPMQPIPPIIENAQPLRTSVAVAPSVEAPGRLSSRDTSTGWERTASPSFGAEARAEPENDEPVREELPVKETWRESRTTTAAAFPFSTRPEPTPSAYREPTLDNVEPEETAEPEITLADIDFQDAFEEDLTSELHVAPGKEDEEPPKTDNIEDEMERLLGDLSRPGKR